LIEVPVPSQESERSCMYVLEVYMLPLSTISLIFDFGIVPTLLHFFHLFFIILCFITNHVRIWRGRRGHDRMVVGFITTYAISAYHHYHCEYEPRSDEVYSIYYYVIKLVSDLRQVGNFFRILRFPPPIKLTATI
jgi:hypothetical protein